MSQLLDIAGQAIGAVLSHPLVGLSIRLLLAYAVIVWLASAWWTWRDARRRTLDPVVPYLAVAGVILATPLLFPLAVVVYRVLRPPLTVAEERAAGLQRLMLEEDAVRSACRRCGGPVEADWVACPACGTELAVPCPTCGRPLELDWRICAWCAADVPWAAAERRAPHRRPVAIPIRPGGRPMVPVMAAPERDEVRRTPLPSGRAARSGPRGAGRER